MDGTVRYQTLSVRKRFKADAALERFFLGVLTEMYVQLSIGEEGLGAECATELLLSAVDEQMGGQGALGDEFGVAEVAGEFLLLAAFRFAVSPRRRDGS